MSEGLRRNSTASGCMPELNPVRIQIITHLGSARQILDQERSQLKIFPQVDSTSFFTGDQFMGCSGEEDSALMHYIGSIGDLQGFPHIVVGDQDSVSLVLKFKYNLLNIDNEDGIDSSEGFVK